MTPRQLRAVARQAVHAKANPPRTPGWILGCRVRAAFLTRLALHAFGCMRAKHETDAELRARCLRRTDSTYPVRMRPWGSS